VIVGLSILAFTCLPARPQDAAPPQRADGSELRAATRAARAACAEDAKKLCTDVEPGGGRIMRCIASHRDQLQPACQEAADKVRALRQANRAGRNASGQCAQDIASFCAGVERGGGRIVRCLREHAGDLQPECRNVVERNRSRQP